MDELKLYAKNTDEIKKTIDLVTAFSKDIGLECDKGKLFCMVAKVGKL